MRKTDTRGVPNLTYIQSFHTVAQHGSLGAAARADGTSVPTLSRHIAALEAIYGVRLFDRRADGLCLTETGAVLFEHAEAVRAAGQKFETAATGRNNDVAGMVSISVSRNFANFILPEIIADLGVKHPEIDIEIIATDQTSNLLMREADIALRMFRPEQSTLFAKQVGTIRLGAYASNAYIERKGMPSDFSQLPHFDIIGEQNSDQINRELESLGLKMTRDDFRYRCDDPFVAWRLVVAGCGIGLGHTLHADQDERVVRVLQDSLDMSRPLWLTSHAELKTSARIRTVFDFLAAELAAKSAT